MGDDSFFGDAVVFRYTRKQALEDGVLISLSEGECSEITKLHFKAPLAATALIIAQLQEVVESGNGDWQGILHDIYSVSKSPFGRTEQVGNGEERHFSVRFGEKTYSLKIHAGAGDDGELVLTLMESNED